MPNKTKQVNEAASLLGKRSAEARKKKWGKEAFAKKLREWGKLGGRPRKKKAAKPSIKTKGE
jgi:hypothetical protein